MTAKELIKPQNYRVIGFKNQSHSMFQAYSSEEVLLGNSKYTFQVKLKGQEAESLTFLTKLDPLLTTVKKVRLETGEFLTEFSDEDILYSIYHNSIEVSEIGNSEDLDDDSLKKRTKYEKLWVLYKTCYDLIYSGYLTKSERYGVFSKNIGDIKISNEYKIPYLSDIIDKFKTKMDLAEEQLNNVEEEVVAALSFTKASSNNTYSERGSF